MEFVGSAATVEAITEAPAATIPFNTKPLLLNSHLLPSHYRKKQNEEQQTWASSFSRQKDPRFRAYSDDGILGRFFFPTTPISHNRAKQRKRLTWDSGAGPT